MPELPGHDRREERRRERRDEIRVWIVPDADRFRSDGEARASVGLERPELTPEPETIDRRSREHDEEWRRHFGDEVGRGLYREMV